MSMSKKDYELIARTIRGVIELSENVLEPHEYIQTFDAYRELSIKLARAFKAQSPTFNPEKFIAACMPTDQDNPA